MKRLLSVLTFFILLTAAGSVHAQQSGDGEFSGLFFSDYYWMAQHHNSDIEGNNGFWFRRIYLTYDYRINDTYSGRVRFETSSPGDWTTNQRMVPNIKDAYLKWQNGDHEILAGVSSTPTYGLIEDVWEYRSVEKSAPDLYGLGSSRDFGIAAKGSLNAENLRYHIFLGNGNSVGPELNSGKKIMVALEYDLTENIVVQGYADWNDQPGENDVSSVQGLIGYQSEEMNLGALYSFQKQENVLPTGEANLDLISLFATKQLQDNLKGYLRVDHMFDGYPGGESNSYIPFAENVESTFLVGGLDFQLDDNISLQPNIEAVLYGEDESGFTPTTDIIPRLTLAFMF